MQLRKVIPMYNGDMESLIRLGKFSKDEEEQFRLRVVEFSQSMVLKQQKMHSRYQEQLYLDGRN